MPDRGHNTSTKTLNLLDISNLKKMYYLPCTCKKPYSKLLLLFLFSFTSLSSFFTHIETNQSVGGAKTGVPGEKPPDTPASRTWLVSHMNSCPMRGANPHRWDDRMIKSTEPLGHGDIFFICEPICSFGRFGDSCIVKGWRPNTFLLVFQNNGVLKKVSSKGWCKKSIYKTFVNILYSLLKIILIIVEVPGGGGYHDIFCVYRLGLFSFHFLFLWVGIKIWMSIFWGSFL